jgi:hypothetical protein
MLALAVIVSSKALSNPYSFIPLLAIETVFSSSALPHSSTKFLALFPLEKQQALIQSVSVVLTVFIVKSLISVCFSLSTEVLILH